MDDPAPRMDDLPEHVRVNRDYWDSVAGEWVAAGRRHWALNEVTWGIWNVPESDAHLLPEVDGRDAIELGCGTGYIASWLARRGARVVGIDNSPRQLETARMLQQEFGIEFPLILGNAETVPLPDASFDLAVSEYGAAIWADPYRWIPEAARLLRPGGELVFLGNSTLLMLCVSDYEADPIGERLLRDYRGMHRFEWPDTAGIEFHLGYGDMIRLLRSSGFEVTDMIELWPPDGAESPFPYVTAEWARRWPSEEVWKARKLSR